jgi:hypothetical protein
MLGNRSFVFQIDGRLPSDAQIQERRRRGTPVRTLAVLLADSKGTIRDERCARGDAGGRDGMRAHFDDDERDHEDGRHEPDRPAPEPPTERRRRDETGEIEEDRDDQGEFEERIQGLHHASTVPATLRPIAERIETKTPPEGGVDVYDCFFR